MRKIYLELYQKSYENLKKSLKDFLEEEGLEKTRFRKKYSGNNLELSYSYGKSSTEISHRANRDIDHVWEPQRVIKISFSSDDWDYLKEIYKRILKNVSSDISSESFSYSGPNSGIPDFNKDVNLLMGKSDIMNGPDILMPLPSN
jgi:hypothetical protein